MGGAHVSFPNASLPSSHICLVLGWSVLGLIFRSVFLHDPEAVRYEVKSTLGIVLTIVTL